jgi:hypothetical protein
VLASGRFETDGVHELVEIVNDALVESVKLRTLLVLQFLRDGAKRQHRTVALFAVLQCWMRNLDGIVFDRRHLERLPGLERFKGRRVAWLKADFKEFSLFKRFITPLKGVLPDGEMLDSRRIEQIPEGGPRMALFQIWPRPTALRTLQSSGRMTRAFTLLFPFLRMR